MGLVTGRLQFRIRVWKVHVGLFPYFLLRVLILYFDRDIKPRPRGIFFTGLCIIFFIAKSAVGAHIMSSLEGVTTLRAFGVEQRFLHMFDVHQDRSTAACYLHLAADRWFGMRVDLIGFALVIGTTLGAAFLVQYKGKKKICTTF